MESMYNENVTCEYLISENYNFYLYNSMNRLNSFILHLLQVISLIDVSDIVL